MNQQEKTQLFNEAMRQMKLATQLIRERELEAAAKMSDSAAKKLARLIAVA